MKVPEFHADFGGDDGPICKSVRWVDTDGKVTDVTHMRITEVVGTVRAGFRPSVTVTFEARLIESEVPGNI